ncbi:MAG: carbon monoxide dehydrogenase subunit G [Proteobacteria bacterium]|nr:carbon monoxide dehydrogenase subunit G [Pseudomonadota bacterium]
MEQSGEYRINAARDEVRQAQNDPDVLAACITGCQSMTRTDDDCFEALVKAKVGPVSATFTAELQLTDVQAPQSYRIVAGVKGGAAGFGKGVAQVSLAEDGDVTVLTYTAQATVGGKLAQVGSRLIDSAAAKMARDFFGAFSERLSPPVAEDEAAATGTLEATVAKTAGGQWLIWTIAFGVLVLALVLAI